MAYYDALIAKWAQAPAGTEQQKLDWINAQTVVGDPIKMIVSPWEIYNRVDRAEFDALTTAKSQPLQRNLQMPSVDFSPGGGARNLFLATFAANSKTLAALKIYTDSYDVPQVNWATAPLSRNGGGLKGAVSHNDLVAAGIV